MKQSNLNILTCGKNKTKQIDSIVKTNDKVVV